MVIVAPSLLGVKPQTLDAVLEAVLSIPNARYLHIDAMDGRFVPDETIFMDPEVTRRIRQLVGDKKTLDVHVMAENPNQYIGDFAKAGADIFTFHYEATERLPARLRRSKEPISIHERKLHPGKPLDQPSRHLVDSSLTTFLASMQ